MKISRYFPSKKKLGIIALIVWGTYITFVGPLNFSKATAASFNFNKAATCNTVTTGGAIVNLVGDNHFGGQFFMQTTQALCSTNQYAKGVGMTKVTSGSHTVLQLYTTCCNMQ